MMGKTFQGSSGTIVGINHRIPAICYSNLTRGFSIEPDTFKDSLGNLFETQGHREHRASVFSIFESASKQIDAFLKNGYRE